MDKRGYSHRTPAAHVESLSLSRKKPNRPPERRAYDARYAEAA
jgi:hypothetical protein